MIRGQYGSPFRPPADGWPAGGRKVFLGTLYQHRRPDLNGFPKYVNTTVVPQPGGGTAAPVTRPFPIPSGTDCESPWDNGQPKAFWIGLGENQDLPKFLGGSLANTYDLSGTHDFGAACRLRGFKNVQAYRQWHGSLPWTSHDGGACNDAIVNTAVTDRNGVAPGGDGYIPTYSIATSESWQPTPTQERYLQETYDVTYSATNFNNGTPELAKYTRSASASGYRLVDGLSGKLTSTLLTTEQVDCYDGMGTAVETRNVSGGAGTQNESTLGPGTFVNLPPTGDIIPVEYASGLSTILDDIVCADVHCLGIPLPPFDNTPGLFIGPSTIQDFVQSWNLWAGGSNFRQIPPVTDIDSYDSGAISQTWATNPGTDIEEDFTFRLRVQWTRTGTTYSWNFTLYYSVLDVFSGNLILVSDITFTGTKTLSALNSSGDVKADAVGLLAYWPLNDDALYPWRTDSIWQLAPLLERDEPGLTVSPVTGFNTYTLDDWRAPLNDKNGNAPFTTAAANPTNNDASGRPSTDPDYSGPVDWIPTYTQMAWFDPATYGFTFAAGQSQATAAATGWKQFANSGKILGMPLPRALSDSDSYWYDSAFTPPTNGDADFENFFDYSQTVYKACQWYGEGGAGPYVDFYPWGYGEWLNDANGRTGAQMPARTTHWLNNFRAMMLPPYAYMLQADAQIYDLDGTPGPSSDFTTGPSGFLIQKSAEIEELWPSYNFFRPAGADKFSLDQKLIYCVTSASGTGDGSAWTMTDISGDTPADGFIFNDSTGLYDTLADYGGIWGGSVVDGFYSGCTYTGGTLTLGTKAYNVPSDWSLPNGDESSAIGPLRFPDAPSILGRAAITAVADAGSHLPFTAGWTPTYQFAVAQTNFGMLLSGEETVDLFDANMTIVASGVTATRVNDTTFTLTSAIAAAYVMIHGAPHWYWDDNQRKGDFTYYSWLLDYRSNHGPSPNNGYASFTETQGFIKFAPCSPMVLAVTPNGETWPNAIVIPFPDTFDFDQRYGARWQFEFEQAMVDLLYQTPSPKCGGGTWTMDDGSCSPDVQYAHFPLVESRLTIPINGGPAENETAPALPDGITIGHASPVTYPVVTNALYEPGMIGYDPTTGNPLPTWTFWGYRHAIETSSCGGSCRFDYVGMENLACVMI